MLMDDVNKYDAERLRRLLRDLFGTVQELERMFPGRKFTPDGHLVGSFGEALAACHYALTLTPPSNPVVDAFSGQRAVQIKATFGNDCVAFYKKVPECVLVLRLNRNGTFEEVFNGCSDGIVAELAKRGPNDNNGQTQLRLSKLRELNIDAVNKLPKMNFEPKSPKDKLRALEEIAGKIEFFEGFDPKAEFAGARPPLTKEEKNDS